MSEIPNVSYEYLLGAVMVNGKPNTYFGSVAIKGDSGIFDDQFRYRITLLVPEEGEREISAIYWIGWKSYDAEDSEKFNEQRFSPDEDGAAKATAWLRERLAAAADGK